MVKDGTATALLKGVRIEGAGEQVSASSVLLLVIASSQCGLVQHPLTLVSSDNRRFQLRHKQQVCSLAQHIISQLLLNALN